MESRLYSSSLVWFCRMRIMPLAVSVRTPGQRSMAPSGLPPVLCNGEWHSYETSLRLLCPGSKNPTRTLPFEEPGSLILGSLGDY
jgi:hypothetical protein